VDNGVILVDERVTRVIYLEHLVFTVVFLGVFNQILILLKTQVGYESLTRLHPVDFVLELDWVGPHVVALEHFLSQVAQTGQQNGICVAMRQNLEQFRDQTLLQDVLGQSWLSIK